MGDIEVVLRAEIHVSFLNSSSFPHKENYFHSTVIDISGNSEKIIPDILNKDILLQKSYKHGGSLVSYLLGTRKVFS